MLLEKMNTSLSEQKEIAKEIRVLYNNSPSFRAVVCESIDVTIPKLLHPLSPGNANAHPDLQGDLITIIFNISIPETTKKSIAENSLVIPFVIESLKYGTTKTRRKAAATLCSLSNLDLNKISIGKSGALKPLIDLLEGGDLLSMKYAASAIFKLCILDENKGRAVSEGAVKVVMKKVKMA